jgi:CDP-diacylglycerol--glycerol-3-phosphate 3-phosphatidyltransferase
MNINMVTLPTYLTLFRLCAAPLVLPPLFVLLLPYDYWLLNYLLAVLFLVFGLTDFFDGFIARRYKQESSLGSVLDPIADKFLLHSSLIGLLAADRISFFWVLMFLCRDLCMMGLRQVAAEKHFSIPVSRWGKVRTFLVMVYITIVIANPAKQLSWTEAPYWYVAEYTTLFLALLLNGVSLKRYYTYFIERYVQSSQKH